MTERKWTIYASSGPPLVISVRLVTHRGKVTDFTVALLLGDPVGNADECVTRYDCADGAPHRDVLGRKSALIRKEFYRTIPKAEVFRYAIHDFKANHGRYLAYYEAN